MRQDETRRCTNFVPMHHPEEIRLLHESILKSYADAALKHATYRQLENGLWFGRVPGLPGAIAFGPSESDCDTELGSVIEDWALITLRAGRTPPPMGEIDFSDLEKRHMALA